MFEFCMQACVTHLAHRDEPFASYVTKLMRDIQLYVTPAPSELVEGSNIRSRVIYLDGIKSRLYEPIKRKEGPQPAFVFYHGGAMCLGSAGMVVSPIFPLV